MCLLRGEGGLVCSPSFLLGGVSADKERTPESQEGGAEGRFGGNDCLLLMFDAND